MREKMQASTRAEIIAKALGQAYREAEESLFETSKWLQILIDCAEDYALFFIDADLKISSWNPGVLKILGYPEDEFVGRPFEELFVDAERAAGIPALEQKSALDTGRALDRRWHRRADGSLIYVTGNLIPLKRDDKLIGYAKIMRDDTYTNQLEEEIAALRKAIEPGIRV
jgi:PAS domain S-box-containing protein